MITVNIVGSCICRDVFSFDQNSDFKVNKFFQCSSPYSIASEEFPDELKINDAELRNKSKWIRSCVCADVNKTIFKSFSENASDYLIIDLCHVRYEICELYFKRKKYYFTRSQFYTENETELKAHKYSGLKIKIIDRYKISKSEWVKVIKNYVHIMTANYLPEKIIVLENFCGKEYVACNGERYSYAEPDDDKLNGLLSELYGMLKKELPSAHYIASPMLLCDEQNKWGKGHLHFVNSFYKYMLAQIKKICMPGYTFDNTAAYSLGLQTVDEVLLRTNKRVLRKRVSEKGLPYIEIPTLTEINFFPHYLQKLVKYKDEIIVIMAAADEASTFWKDSIFPREFSKNPKISPTYRSPYISVNNFSENFAVETHDTHYGYKWGEYYFDIISRGFVENVEMGKSEVNIHCLNYEIKLDMPKQRGLTVVVFSKKYGMPIDLFVVDFFVDAFYRIYRY